ncbi:MAG: LacI family DNA-binding transcriptional regulator [Solobacterium sp.]|nr:LacI family DNA-binding transcriptional regulator [Solobacterium sp.]
MISAKEIAQKLGVSPSAVSIAMNNRPGISDETREMILKAADEMGYVHKKRKSSFGSILHLFVSSSFTSTVPFDNNMFLDKVIQGISLEAQQLNYTLHITYTTFRNLTAEKIIATMDANTSGIILLPTAGEMISPSILKSLKIPFITLDKPTEMYGLDSVTIANAQGIFLAVQHLFSLGHTNIAHIGGEREFTNFSERIQGYINSVAMHPEMKGSENNVFRIDQYSNSESKDYSAALNEIFDYLENSKAGMPTGFICATDWLAVGCVQTLTARGYRIPQDISVIGFDNIPISEITVPHLTTVNVPKERLGALAVNRLHDIICGRAKERTKTSVLTNLLVRESTGPVKRV